MEKYDFKKIEIKWQQEWETQKAFKAKDDMTKPKFYGLIEFPYPSGAGLHVGHPLSYTALDIICRQKRMSGFNVLYPIGFDSFGLPTENYAIKTGRNPAEVTTENIANFVRQLKMLGLGFDWDRAVNTSDPAYYKWTQWIFLQLYKHGLAYKANMPINWCPSCKIGLANEEVVDGACERCGGPVEKRNKEQWMLKITAYAEKLLKGLNDVDYILPAKTQQKNWIGKSEGARVKFLIAGTDYYLDVFTTRPDTLFGATYMVVAPEHELLTIFENKIENLKEITNYCQQAKLKSDLERTELQKEKTGVKIKGLTAVNPVNNEELPIFVADYVLATYGTGAIMAVPGHDSRDFEFATKFSLPIKWVVNPVTASYLIIEKSLPKEAVSEILQGKYGLCEVEKTDEAWGRFLRVHVPQTQEDDLIKFLKDNLLTTSDDGGAWYADSMGTTNMVVFPKKQLRILDALTLKEYQETGLNWHIPEKELDITLTEVNVFTEEGVSCESGFLTGLSTAAAKNKAIEYLQEKNLGSAKVNYRLRDWVFSRQRYWGEPIPLVYCEHCAAQKQKVLLVHGFEGSGQGNWFPWMKEELEKQGFEVFAPTMTSSRHPDLEQWLQELMPFMEKLNESDIIIGHSLGSKAVLHLLEKANKKIGHVYLIASAIGQIESRDWQEFKNKWPESDIDALQKFWQAPIAWEKINDLIDSKNIVLSDDDPYIKVTTHAQVPVGWYYQLWSGFSHFQGQKYPELLELILSSKNNGWVPLSENELPLTLPVVEKYQPTDTGESPLAAMTSWVQTVCPRCGRVARRETDVMPNWAGSSWYFLRYCDSQNNQIFASKEALKYWMQVDWYNGGMEHVVLHLLYSRFWNQFLFDLGYVPYSEPYKKRTSHGLILAKGGEKMSKSKGNVVNPDEIVERAGADSLRTYLMFMGPFDQAKEWDTNGLLGVKRFLERVWNMQEKVATSAVYQDELKLQTCLHQTIKKVTEDIEQMRFNTAVAALMELSNETSQLQQISKNFYETFVLLLSPFAPHLAEEIWQNLGRQSLICQSSWPVYDPQLCETSDVTIAIQINGKLRATLVIKKDSEEENVKNLVLQHEKIKPYLEAKPLKKFIYVKNKLVNLVV